MAANNTISIGFKVEDVAGGFKELIVNAESFRKTIGAAVKEAQKIENPAINFAAFATSLDSVGKSLTDLQNICKDLSNAYAVQIQAETQLQTVMRQRMSATEEEIQSIKNLASAQQELGVIGDEVQLSGAQQMATFLTEKQSIDTLLPAMNNLLAQQKGLNATTQDAVTVGNLMGKAMQGQTSALTRVGITFNEAQEKVMKFGSESERAATLAEIITQNVGNMNAELAKTDPGKQKQLENKLGDIKEQIGSVVQGFMPYLTTFNAVVLATLNLTKVTKGLCAAGLALHKTINLQSIASVAVTGHHKMQAVALRILTAAYGSATVGAGALTAATIALEVVLTGGIAAAVMGLVSLFTSWASSADDASSSIGQFDEATTAYTNAAAEAKLEIDNEAASLKALMDANEDTEAAVNALNEKYGDVFGTHEKAADWYDILTNKSRDYIKQIGLEAEAKVLASQLARQEIERQMAEDKKTELEETGKHKTTQMRMSGSSITGVQTYTVEVETEEYKRTKEELEAANAAIAETNKRFDTVKQLMVKPDSGTGKTDTDSEPDPSKNKAQWHAAAKNIKEYSDNITILNERLETATKKDAALINTQIKGFKEKIEEIRNAGLSPDTSGSPFDYTTLDQFTAKLAELDAARKTATASQIAAIDAETSKIKALQQAFEDSAKFRYDVSQNRYTPKTTLPWDFSSDINIIKPKIEMTAIDEFRANLRAVGKDAKISVQDAADAVGQFGGSLAGLGNALEIPELNVAGTMAQAIATMVAGYAQATSKSGSLGLIGWITMTALGLAQLTAIVSSVKSLPQFANGGIAYGPTLGIFGEYAGASNNPEVVAPLDKLRTLIAPRNDDGGTVRFKIDGRTLVGVLEKENNFRNRS